MFKENKKGRLREESREKVEGVKERKMTEIRGRRDRVGKGRKRGCKARGKGRESSED